AVRSSLRESSRSDGSLQALARGRFRGGGEAPDHDRHLRPVGRVLRRLLSEGAEGKTPDRGRFRSRLLRSRCVDGADDTDSRVPDRRQGVRSRDDVSQRHLYDRRQPGGCPRDVAALRLCRRVAGGVADRRAAVRRSAHVERGAPLSARDGLALARAGSLRMKTWETVIGLEIHAQLSTQSKIFSGSATAYGAPPNAQADLVDLGYPGVLPVLNAVAVQMAVKFGLAIDARIARHSVFARENYFYPDLPKGYQISQYELPVVGKGAIDIVLDDGAHKR